MSVAKKLYLLIAVAVVALLLLSGISYIQLGKVYSSANYANENTVPSLIQLQKISADYGRVRIRVDRHVMNTDNSKMLDIESSVLQAQEAVSAGLKQYETKFISDAKDKSILDQEKSLFQEYVAALPPILEQSKSNHTDKALELLNKQIVVAQKLNKVIDEHILYNEELGAKAAAEAAATQGSATTILVSVSVAACVAMFIIGLAILRNLLRQLGGEPVYVTEVVKAVADGDLTVRIDTKSNDNSSMLFSIKAMVEKLSHIIGEVRGAANSLSSASQEVSSTAQSLSQSSSEQAASVEETTASIEEMTASISQNTENARVTDSMATKAASEANEGGQAVSETVDAMKQIADKIGIVDDIAYQTNLLALNAAIEAARAGEHGKGFAVVAAEVRKLAERSQVAAQEIGELAGSSVKMAEKAGTLLSEMVPTIKKTSDLVQEINAASQEQSTGVSQINSAMGQLNQATQQNASASEELAATAEEMGAQATQLQELMLFFKMADSSADSTRAAAKARAIPRAPSSTRGSSQAMSQPADTDFEKF